MLATRKSTKQVINAQLEAEDKNISRYLTFFIGSRIFAINILVVKEILEYNDITDIPRTPDFLRGAINLRGRIIPVVDLSIRLGYEQTEISKRSCIIVVELTVNGEAINVGVVVDSVNKVMDLNADQVEKAPTFGGNISTDYIEGMGKVNTNFVVILDVQHVLSMDDLNTIKEYLDEQSEETPDETEQ